MEASEFVQQIWSTYGAWIVACFAGVWALWSDYRRRKAERDNIRLQHGLGASSLAWERRFDTYAHFMQSESDAFSEHIKSPENRVAHECEADPSRWGQELTEALVASSLHLTGTLHRVASDLVSLVLVASPEASHAVLEYRTALDDMETQNKTLRKAASVGILDAQQRSAWFKQLYHITDVSATLNHYLRKDLGVHELVEKLTEKPKRRFWERKESLAELEIVLAPAPMELLADAQNQEVDKGSLPPTTPE